MTASKKRRRVLRTPNWQVISAGHWNGDGHSDLLFQHANGTLAVWFMNGNVRESVAFLSPSHPGDSRWRVVGVGDLNADGNSDLVFQHIDGTLAAWFMKGVEAEEPRFLEPAYSGDADWQVTALGDFNGDGKDDLLFQHRSGTLGVWLMDPTRLVQASLLRPADPGHFQWRVAGAADWNRDGQCDLLMQSVVDGSLAMWFMDGTKLAQAGFVIPRMPGGTWKAVAPK